MDGAQLVGPPEDFDPDGDLDLQLVLSWIATPGQSTWARTGANHTIESLQFGEESESVRFSQFFPYGRRGQLDIDGDGDLDLLPSFSSFRINEFQRLRWFENRGGGNYEPSLKKNDGSTPEGKLIAPTRVAGRNSYVMGDLDGDGINDLIVGSSGWASRLEWFKISKASQPQIFEDWAVEKSLSGHSVAPEADWDGDAYSNWEEFAFGSDPVLVDPDHPGEPHLQVGPAGPALVSIAGLTLRLWDSPTICS